MNKLYALIASLIAFSSLHGMRPIESLPSKKRETPETISPNSIDKKAKADTKFRMRTYNPAFLLDITSLAVSKFISQGKISKADFETQTPKDIHPHVMRFQDIGNDLVHLLNISITSENADAIPGSYISRLLSLGANPNRTSLQKSSLSLAISKGKNTEHLEALASHPRTDLENECSSTTLSLLSEKPLIKAIMWGKGLPIIKTLVLNGANVNARSQFYFTAPNGYGYSVLRVLCENPFRYTKKECFEIVEFLLEHGANPNEVMLDAVAYAETKEILQKYGYKS